MKKLRHREVKGASQGHIDSQGEGEGLNTGHLAPPLCHGSGHVGKGLVYKVKGTPAARTHGHVWAHCPFWSKSPLASLPRGEKPSTHRVPLHCCPNVSTAAPGTPGWGLSNWLTGGCAGVTQAPSSEWHGIYLSCPPGPLLQPERTGVAPEGPAFAEASTPSLARSEASHPPGQVLVVPSYR